MDIENEKMRFKLKLKNQLKTSRVHVNSENIKLKKSFLSLLTVIMLSIMLEFPFYKSFGLVDSHLLDTIISLLEGLLDVLIFFFFFSFTLCLSEYGAKRERKETIHIETKDSELPLALSLFESFKNDELFISHLKNRVKNMTDEELRVVLKKGDAGTADGLHFIKSLTKEEARNNVDLLKKKRDGISVEIKEIEKNNNLQSNTYQIKND